ncbi:MAG: acyl-CoA dehydrogenase family protein [Chryseosolibacter sp.]
MDTALKQPVLTLEAIIGRADEIAKTVVKTERIAADKNATWVKESMDVLKNEKITALLVPKDSGGLGHGLYALARVCETLGAAYSSVGLCFGMHCVGTAVIAAKATSWQRENYLEKIAAGRHLTTLALSEPGTGSHFYLPQTSLMPVSEHKFLINGGKTFVTNGGYADSYVVSTMAATDDANPEQFSCIVLDADTPGMEWGKEWDGLGMRGNSSRSLKLTNVMTADRQILGQQGDQLWYMFNVVAPYFLIAMSGTYLGIAQCAVQEARDILMKRVYSHNGTQLSQISFLQHRMGTLWARVERTRALIYHAAQLGDAGAPQALQSILAAKAEVASCCVDTVNDVMTIAGGIGYSGNSFLGMLLRDARASHVMAPTTDILYTWLGRSLLDQPILSD